MTMAANAVAKNTVGTFAELFKAKSKNLAGLIPRHLTPERVAKIAISALMRNQTLLQCKPETVWFQVAQAATLGLEVNLLGAAYLVPFKNGKTGGMDCQLIVGYQGLIDLARRSGNIESIEARIVYENDVFELENGLEPVLRHKPCLDSDPGKMRLVYAVAKLKDGGRQVEYMTKTEVDAIRRRSKAKDSGPWVTDYEEMARKTVVRRLAKYLPKSIEMAQAMTLDAAGDSGEPALAGLDIEDDAILADADIIPEEESETDKLKSDMRSRKNAAEEAAPGSAHTFKQAYAKLSMLYDERGNEVDDMLRMNGVNMPLMDIPKDCADPKVCAEIVRIAAEF
jgi:recombination protein RecT